MEKAELRTAIIAVACALAAVCHAQAQYTCVDLGGDTAFCINNHGQVVGASGGRAVVFDTTGGGNHISLGVVGGSVSRAYCISDSGIIVGASTLQGTHPLYPALFDVASGGPIALDSDGQGAVYWVNNAGTAVGAIRRPVNRAVVFDVSGAGNHLMLGTLPGLSTEEGVAMGINLSGQIVGYATRLHIDNIPVPRPHATLFDPVDSGNNIDLHPVPDSLSYAYSINDQGQIVGELNSLAALFDSTGQGRTRVLDSQGHDSRVWNINNAGQMVGERDGRATLFDPSAAGAHLDLNSVVSNSYGGTLTCAYGINDDGWIAGKGTRGAVLLVPDSVDDVTLTVVCSPEELSIETVTPKPGVHVYRRNTTAVLCAWDFAQCPRSGTFSHWEGPVDDPNDPMTTAVISDDTTITAVFTLNEPRCGDPCHPIVKGDLNADCYVNFADFVIYCSSWLSCTHPDCD